MNELWIRAVDIAIIAQNEGTYGSQTKKATQMMLHWIPFAKGSPKEGHCNGTRSRSEI